MERDKLIKYCREYIGNTLDHIKATEHTLAVTANNLDEANEYSLTMLYNMLFTIQWTAERLKTGAENARREIDEWESFSTKSDVGL